MVSSVFDLTETVTKIINLERETLDERIKQNKERESDSKRLSEIQSSVKSLISTLDTLERESTFDSKKATSTDSTVLSASSSVGAAEILFDITVNTLAVAARAVSSATIFGVGREGTATKITGAEINTTVGQKLDPNANVISGSPNFDGGGNLSTGSFFINDAQILVSSSDTVNTILTKINNSSADVTAYYDESTDKVIIEHNQKGEQYTITLESDSSGFFQKLKLTSDYGATETEGEYEDLYKDLKDTAIGASISYGYLTVNDRTFLVDPNNDSLNDIISRINNSSAGVSMFYDEVSDKITMTSKEEGKNIVLKNDDADFWDAVNLLNGVETSHTYTGTQANVTVNGTTFNVDGNEISMHGTTIQLKSLGSASVKVEPDHETFVKAVSNMVTKFNDASSKINEVIDSSDSSSSFAYRMMTGIRNLVQGRIENSGTYSYLSEIGISFSRGIVEGRMQFDEEIFRESLLNDQDSVKKLFSYDSDNDGLLDDGGIANTLESYLKGYSRSTLGLIDQRKTTLNKMIEKSQRSIDRQELYFDSRETYLLESLIRTQKLLQTLESEYQNATSVRVDFSLITGSLLK